MSNVVNIDFKNIKNAVPAFLTIVTMLLAYSITKGIGVGVISYVLINVVVYLVDLIKYGINKENAVKPKWELSVVILVVFALFLVYFFVPTEI